MANLAQAAYMVAAALFVIGIMLLRAPATARTGNLVAALGMLIALVFGVVATHLYHTLLLAGLFVIAGVAGAVVARRVRMTAMPQLVALFNGMGGGAAALVALDVTLKAVAAGSLSGATSIPGFFTLIIGSVSFAGSLIAFAKLQEILSGRPMVYPGQAVMGIGHKGGRRLVFREDEFDAVGGEGIDEMSHLPGGDTEYAPDAPVGQAVGNQVRKRQRESSPAS